MDIAVQVTDCSAEAYRIRCGGSGGYDSIFGQMKNQLLNVGTHCLKVSGGVNERLQVVNAFRIRRREIICLGSHIREHPANNLFFGFGQSKYFVFEK